MELIKCKMCGGDLDLDSYKSIGICKLCGSTMTVPSIFDKKRISLYNRANYYRMNCEFDKAIEIYENILSDYNLESEAHWGIVLCKYGIEYVEDKKNNIRIPTCHIANYNSIFSDYNYNEALKYANSHASEIYEKEAKKIDDLIKNIVNNNLKEEPYDASICNKETDDFEEQIQDSVIAQEIPEYLTEEDIKSSNNQLEPLLKRAIMFLEDKDFIHANEYLERVLDLDPECSKAYVGKLMVERMVSTEDELKNGYEPLEKSIYYNKIIRFADKTIKERYISYNKYIIDKSEEIRKQNEELRKQKAILEVEELERISQIRIKQEKKNKKIYRIILISLFIIVFSFAIIDTTFSSKIYYDKAIICFKNNEIAQARTYIQKSNDKYSEQFYDIIINEISKNINDENIEKLDIFIEEIKKDEFLYKKYIDMCYESALKALDDGNIESTNIFLSKVKIDDKLDKSFIKKCYNRAIECLDERDVFAALNYMNYVNVDAKLSNFYREVCYEQANTYLANKDYYKSLDLFRRITGYKDSVVAIRHIITNYFEGCFAMYNSDFIALKDDGTCLSSNSEYDISDFINIVSLSANDEHIVGLKEDGTVAVLSVDTHEQCAITNWNVISAICASDSGVYGVKRDGTVIAESNTQYPFYDPTKYIGNWTNIIDISANSRHVVGLRSDGTVIAEGLNNHGECDVSQWSDIVSIYTGYSYTVGLKKNGMLKIAGKVEYKDRIEKNWNNIASVIPDSRFILGLQTDGTIVASSINNYYDKNVYGWENVVALYGSEGDAYALLNDGTFVNYPYFSDYDIVQDWNLIK